MTTLSDYRTLVRNTARNVETKGYLDNQQLNQLLVRLGLEPYPKFQAVLTATGTINLSSGSAEGAALEVEALRARPGGFLVSGYNWEVSGSPEVSVVNLEEVDSELEPGADTDDLDAYKKVVRRVALREAVARNWCDSGLNRYLEKLGLAPRGNVTVPVRVTTSTIQRVRVPEAEDYADAVRMVSAGEVEEAVRTAVGPGTKVLDSSLVDMEDVEVDDGDPTDSYVGTLHCNDKSGRWRCTRVTGHAGQHIAGNGSRVCGVWPQ